MFLYFFSVPAFAWQQKSIPIDTIPSKKDLVPYTIKLPKLPRMGRDSVHNNVPWNGNKNLLAFPFAVRSLETNWGFGGIAARFFKPGKHDTTVRTSDVNLLALYTLRSQLILVLSSITANSAFHGTRLDVDHIGEIMEQVVAEG